MAAQGIYRFASVEAFEITLRKLRNPYNDRVVKVVADETHRLHVLSFWWHPRGDGQYVLKLSGRISSRWLKGVLANLEVPIDHFDSLTLRSTFHLKQKNCGPTTINVVVMAERCLQELPRPLFDRITPPSGNYRGAGRSDES